MDNRIIILIVIGVVIVIFTSAIISSPTKTTNSPTPTSSPTSGQTGTGTNNQVQVSGSVEYGQTGSIEFTGLTSKISSSASISNGRYSILLVGGQSYAVTIRAGGTYYLWLYVPSGAATFTADF